jgi:hypothetical protein
MIRTQALRDEKKIKLMKTFIFKIKLNLKVANPIVSGRD